MAFKIKKQEGGSGLLFWVLLVLMIYGLVSAGIAWQTLDKCGNERSPKEWVFYPPGWKCT